MALEKVLSKDFVLNVNTGTDVSPDWTKIGGRKDLTMTMSANKVDLKDVDSLGWADERILGYALSFGVTANRIEDEDDGSRDPGQAAVEAVMFETGAAAHLGFQIITPGGETWVFDAAPEVTPFGGDQDSGSAWSATLNCSGPPTVTAG